MVKTHTGFTLAEVLITLGIIGVVAAITIPTLQANIAKQEYVTSLKKAYTNFNQVLSLISENKGCVNDLRCTEIFSDDITSDAPGNEISKYFKIVKNCGMQPNQGCFPSKTMINIDGSKPKFGGAASNLDASIFSYKFITADGASIAIESLSKECTSTETSGYLSQVCGNVTIDVNNLKKPNVYGRDTFEFDITNGKGGILYPKGGQESSSPWNDTFKEVACATNGGVYGVFCAGRILEEGWQMNY